MVAFWRTLLRDLCTASSTAEIDTSALLRERLIGKGARFDNQAPFLYLFCPFSFFSPRSPGAHVEDIQVWTPSRGRMYFCSAIQQTRKPIKISKSLIVSPPDALYRICRKMYMVEILCYVPCDFRTNLGISAVSTSPHPAPLLEPAILQPFRSSSSALVSL